MNEAARIDLAAAHPARVYDYLLGGTTNFPVDREVAGKVFEGVYPEGLSTARADVRANRGFLGRAVRYLAGEVGVRQFLDIGTGIPTPDGNAVHEVVQDVAAGARIVYVDNDPVVLAHSHALLNRLGAGGARYVIGHLQEPGHLLVEAALTLDFSQPVAVLLVGVLHFIEADEDPYGIVSELLRPLPSGSHLVVSHLASDIQPEQMAEVAARTEGQPVREQVTFRSQAEVSRFFDGLELVDPGVVSVTEWRSQHPPSPGGWQTPIHCGVGRKP